MESSNRRKVVIFGGNFDPPTCGHLFVASRIVNTGRFDEIWFVPTGDKRYDRGARVSGGHRVQMLELAVLDELWPKHVTVQVRRDQLSSEFAESRSVDLMEHLVAESPELDFYFAIGADRVDTLPAWERFSRLNELVDFIAIPRKEADMTRVYPPYVELLPKIEGGGFYSVSSTAARYLIGKNLSTAGVVASSVRDYIEREKLYRGAK